MNTLTPVRPSAAKSARNMGIELLRIVSMLMVVTLHCLSFGGILDAAPSGSAAYHAAWLLECACYGAVNIYGLITGYACIRARHKSGRLFQLWLEVVFVLLACTVIFVFIPHGFSWKELLRALLPVAFYRYWYFSAYFFLFFFIPSLNAALTRITRCQHRTLIAATVGTAVLFNAAACVMGGDIFHIMDGYSPLWLVCLYIIGAYLRLYPEDTQRIPSAALAGTFVLCTAAAWASRLVILRMDHFGGYVRDMALIQYNSPLILAAAAALVILFARIPIRGVKAGRVIRLFSASSFGVLIIHLEENFLRYFLVGRLVPLLDLPWFGMIAGVAGAALVLYLFCTLLSLLQQLLFRLMHIPQMCDALTGRISALAVRLGLADKEE